MKYLVITPEYETDNNPWGLDPPEITCDVVEVEAPNKREARRLGYHELRKLHRGWMTWYRDMDRNPFSGLVVEEAA